jgi:hypothetical protein
MNRTAPRHRIEELARTGRSAGAIAKILASEGYTDGASRASVGRLLAELRGPLRSPRVTRPKPVDAKPTATVALPSDAGVDAVCDHAVAISDWIDARVAETVAVIIAATEAASGPPCPGCGRPTAEGEVTS